METKVCRLCGFPKDIEEFYRRSPKNDWRMSECKECCRKKSKSPERKAFSRQWKAKTGADYKYSVKYKYGLSWEQYEQMFQTQGGVCAVCNLPETIKIHGKIKKLCVDHSAATGKVRGLLCNGCNRAIGSAKDDPQILRGLAIYLEKTS